MNKYKYLLYVLRCKWLNAFSDKVIKIRPYIIKPNIIKPNKVIELELLELNNDWRNRWKI